MGRNHRGCGIEKKKPEPSEELASFPVGTAALVPPAYVDKLIQINVIASNSSSVHNLNINMPTSPKEPSSSPEAHVEASNSSTVSDVDVAAGKARLNARDRSAIQGVKVGSGAKKKWWLAVIAAVGLAIVGSLVKVAAEHFLN